MVGSDGRPPPAPPCLAPVHLQLPTCNASNAYLHQDLPTPSFPPLLRSSSAGFVRAVLSPITSVSLAPVENAPRARGSYLAIASCRESFAATNGLAEPPDNEVSNGTKRIYTGEQEKEKGEATLPRRASRTINHGRVLRFCRASRPTCVPRAPLFRV